MTAGPTLAMQAAARGEPYTIGWASRSTLTYAGDAAGAFVDAARGARDGAFVFNIPGSNAQMREVVAAIRDVVPDGAVDFDDVTLPFPEEFATGGLPLQVTPLGDGVRETIESFRRNRRG
jgi:nucleoside-diphosphate-sugar epimerase